jgi:hypothetical protein
MKSPAAYVPASTVPWVLLPALSHMRCSCFLRSNWAVCQLKPCLGPALPQCTFFFLTCGTEWPSLLFLQAKQDSLQEQQTDTFQELHSAGFWQTVTPEQHFVYLPSFIGFHTHNVHIFPSLAVRRLSTIQFF